VSTGSAVIVGSGIPVYAGTYGAVSCHGVCPENGTQGFQGFQGFDGSQGYQGFDGAQGFQGPAGEKPAILNTSKGYRELACIEAPEVLFFDTMRVDYAGTYGTFDLDPLFVEVCEPGTIHVISVVPNEPVAVGAEMVSNGKLILRSSGDSPMRVTVMLSGIRKGFSGRRFVERTQKDFDRNVEFWGQLWKD
jgi:hypothetical protein